MSKWNDYLAERYEENKIYLINLLGGKCIQCNSIENLQFDHIDPSTKLFAIGDKLNHDLNNLLEEIKKCQLLCTNCHKIKHGAVEHGGGLAGKYKCNCHLCREKRLNYQAKWREERKRK